MVLVVHGQTTPTSLSAAKVMVRSKLQMAVRSIVALATSAVPPVQQARLQSIMPTQYGQSITTSILAEKVMVH